MARVKMILSPPSAVLHPKKKTVGVRIPEHVVAQVLLAELGEPLLSSTLLLPDHEAPLTQGWEIKEELDNAVDAVIDSGECGTEPTTVIDLSGDEPEIIRKAPATSRASCNGRSGLADR